MKVKMLIISLFLLMFGSYASATSRCEKLKVNNLQRAIVSFIEKIPLSDWKVDGVAFKTVVYKKGKVRIELYDGGDIEVGYNYSSYIIHLPWKLQRKVKKVFKSVVCYAKPEIKILYKVLKGLKSP